MRSDKFMRAMILLPLLFFLLIQSPTFAQSSAAGSFEGNLGSWTWGKQQTPPSSEVEELEGDDEGRGETSWERLNTERSEELEPSTSEQTPKSLTPVDLWRMLWSKLTKDE